MRVRRIDHVQLAMPPGREAEARTFYRDLLGISETQKPPNLAARGGCWFEDGPLKVHLGVDSEFRPARKAHPALLVEDLPSLVARLRAAGVAVREDEPLDGYCRVYADDPFGNRIELMEPEATAGLQPRLADAGEALAVADLWLGARRASVPQVPPPVHPDEEVRAWFQEVVFPSENVWVVEASGELVALMVLRGDWIDQMYVHPRWWSRGLGSRLLEVAKRERDALDLWTFESNTGARRFYERHGFVAVARSTGDNEEGEPDLRYHWHRP